MSTETQQALDQEHIRKAAHELIDLGLSFARMLHAQAEADPTPDHPTQNLPALAAAFERVSQGTRRATLLAQKLSEPPPPTLPRHLARRQIIREVEDTILSTAEQRGLDPDQLHPEFLDRLDALDRDNELAARPLDTIIAEICRDLGVYDGIGIFKPRTPEAVQALNAQAAQPAPPADTPPRPNRPKPGPNLHWFDRLPKNNPQAMAMLLGHIPKPKPRPRPPD